MNEIENRTTENLAKKIEIWDNSKRAKILINVFWALTSLLFVSLLSGYFELSLLKSVQQGNSIDEIDANASDLMQMIIGLLQTGLHIASIIVFLNWFRRAYGNLHRLKISYIKHSESTAVWSWFVPILFLFRPVQIMNEIWTETQEKIKKYNSSYVLKSGGLIIGLWWTFFIFSNFIGKYVLKTAFKDSTIDQLIEGSQALIISDIMQIPEALLVILIVYKLSEMETKLATEVKKSGGNIVFK